MRRSIAAVVLVSAIVALAGCDTTPVNEKVNEKVTPHCTLGPEISGWPEGNDNIYKACLAEAGK